MESLKIAICDDEKMSLDIIAGAIESAFASHGVTVRKELFDNAGALYSRAEQTVFDLIFLDIEIAETDGIELGKLLRRKGITSEIAFVSSHADRVFESFSLHPFGFVRKNNFLNDIERLVEAYFSNKMQSKNVKSLTLKTANSLVSVNVDDIEYIESEQRYQSVHFTDKRIKPLKASSTINSLEDTLSAEGFYRCHKGFIICFSQISIIKAGEVLMKSGAVIPVSRAKRKDIKSLYLNYMKDNNCIIDG